MANTLLQGKVFASEHKVLNTSSLSASVPEFIRAKPGDNVTLPCRAPSYTMIRAVVWSRPDLEPGDVLKYQNRKSDPENQHPEVKDRDMSLVLRNVMTGDSGTYECHVFLEQPIPKKTVIETEHISIDPFSCSVEVQQLPGCPFPSSTDITTVEWNKLGLEPEYVAKYQDGKFDPGNQHPSFKDRVELEGSEMKDGDVSLVLRNVTIIDNGNYKCHVFQGRKEIPHHHKRQHMSLAVWNMKHVKHLLSLSASVPEFIRAKPGDNVTLPCRAPSYTMIRAVVWSRPDLEPGDVLKYQNRKSDPENQHPSFKSRVELEDSEMKNGDVSLVLRNVTTGDRGTYECRVFHDFR
uniref:Ig-like domain-containing protein n=1 Tax=Monopterus albus TaxID=43700 RepID=A0A3Q3JBL2_MONAL